MKKELASKSEIKLIGISARTNNKADFELYDQRAMDPAAAVLDIYIGII